MRNVDHEIIIVVITLVTTIFVVLMWLNRMPKFLRSGQEFMPSKQLAAGATLASIAMICACFVFPTHVLTQHSTGIIHAIAKVILVLEATVICACAGLALYGFFIKPIEIFVPPRLRG